MGDFDAWCARGRAAVRDSRFADAEAAYRAAIGVAPASLKARLELSVVLRRCRKPADAEAVLAEALAIDPSLSDRPVRAGGGPLRAGEIRRGGPRIRRCGAPTSRLRAGAPQPGAVPRAPGTVRGGRGRLSGGPAAAAQRSRGAGQSRHRPAPATPRGDAETVYREAIGSTADPALGHAELGRVLFEQRRYADAAAAFRAAILLRPQDARSTCGWVSPSSVRASSRKR